MTKHEDALAWRAERALRMAWPAVEEQACGDWLARFAPGLSRRANSANPTRSDPRNIAACEALYRARRASAMFRLPTIVAPAADERLARLNYSIEGETVTLYAELEPQPRDASVEIDTQPRAAWLAAMAALQGQTPDQAAIYARVVQSLAIPAGFAALREDGGWAALAFGAIHDGLICCESVVVDRNRRGRGLARRMMNALLAWGAERGARDVCLQVAADNAPALALYRGLGLRTELYRYHYRREPKAD
jgi:ribosomal protein S18 acetylase RimI-like enzyme